MTRAERRHKDFVKALRKKRIALDLYNIDWYTSLHAYSKNKIHCSCPYCTSKTNNKHRHAFYSSYNPSISEKRLNITAIEELENND